MPALVKKIWNMDLVTVSYEPELDKLIAEARADEKAVALAKQRAEAYLALPDTKLETKREFVDNCFLLDQVFRRHHDGSRIAARLRSTGACRRSCPRRSRRRASR